MCDRSKPDREWSAIAPLPEKRPYSFRMVAFAIVATIVGLLPISVIAATPPTVISISQAQSVFAGVTANVSATLTTGGHPLAGGQVNFAVTNAQGIVVLTRGVPTNKVGIAVLPFL